MNQTYLNLKRLCTAKGTIDKMKKTMECEKIFANDVTGVNIKNILTKEKRKNMLTAYTTQRANKPIKNEKNLN